LLLLSSPAYAQYFDGLPVADGLVVPGHAPAVTSTTIVPLCVGNVTSSVPGKCTPARTTAGALTANQLGPLYPFRWTTATRPTSPGIGAWGYNTDIGSTEFWNGSNWTTGTSATWLGGVVPNPSTFQSTLTLTENYGGTNHNQQINTFNINAPLADSSVNQTANIANVTSSMNSKILWTNFDSVSYGVSGGDNAAGDLVARYMQTQRTQAGAAGHIWAGVSSVIDSTGLGADAAGGMIAHEFDLIANGTASTNPAKPRAIITAASNPSCNTGSTGGRPPPAAGPENCRCYIRTSVAPAITIEGGEQLADPSHARTTAPARSRRHGARLRGAGRQRARC
jgi:hypothetical protein